MKVNWFLGGQSGHLEVSAASCSTVLLDLYRASHQAACTPIAGQHKSIGVCDSYQEPGQRSQAAQLAPRTTLSTTGARAQPAGSRHDAAVRCDSLQAHRWLPGAQPASPAAAAAGGGAGALQRRNSRWGFGSSTKHGNNCSRANPPDFNFHVQRIPLQRSAMQTPPAAGGACWRVWRWARRRLRPAAARECSRPRPCRGSRRI